MGLLLCFLPACHWYPQHPGDKRVAQPTEASWSRALPMCLWLVLRKHRAWHCYLCPPCRDPDHKGGSAPSPIAMGKVSQSPPSLCSQEAVAPWGAWCGNKPINTRLGAHFFCNSSLSNSLLRSESFLFCSFFWQCWSYSFSVHAKPPQREKADLMAVHFLHCTWGLICFSVVTPEAILFAGYYFSGCSFSGTV